MKVVAINASPMMDKGNTAVILTPFLDGLRAAGAEVELFYTKQLSINPCQGEFNCWVKTPGRCFQADDMQTLHPKLSAADIWVFATPLYVWGVAGPLKNLMDRLIPLIEPAMVLRNGHCSHPPRADRTNPKLVLVSNCGFWEMDNFDAVLMHFRCWAKSMDTEFAGALLRPHGPALGAMLHTGAPVGDVIEAARRAGRELVTTGKMSAATLAVVSRELLPLEAYIERATRSFERRAGKAAGVD
jgi:multimeric flavodoxin WrbA